MKIALKVSLQISQRSYGKNMLGLMLMAIRDGKGMPGPNDGNPSVIKQHAQNFERTNPYQIL